MVAKKTASSRLKSGPANATMILSPGEAGGRSSCGVLGLALDRLHRRHLRQGDVAAGRDRAEDVLHAVDLLFPDRLAEPDGELLDLQPPPARGQEVAQLVDDDEQVEEQNDLQQRDRAKERGAKTAEDADRDDDQQEENDESQEPGIQE